jgi:hypothetical protein
MLSLANPAISETFCGKFKTAAIQTPNNLSIISACLSTFSHVHLLLKHSRTTNTTNAVTVATTATISIGSILTWVENNEEHG